MILSNYWQLWALDSRLWWPVTLIPESEYTFFRSLQNREKYAELAFSFCTLVINLGNFIKGLLSKHLQKYSTRFINMQLSIIERRKTPVYDLISPGIGLKFGLISFCFQTQYDFLYKVKYIYIYIYIYSWALFSSKNVDPGQWTILGMDYWSL